MKRQHSRITRVGEGMTLQYVHHIGTIKTMNLLILWFVGTSDLATISAIGTIFPFPEFYLVRKFFKIMPKLYKISFFSSVFRDTNVKKFSAKTNPKIFSLGYKNFWPYKKLIGGKGKGQLFKFSFQCLYCYYIPDNF